MITAIDLRNLRNAEFLQFCALLSGLVVANNPNVLNVTAQHTAFQLRLDEMSGLFKLEKVNPITEELVQLDERRDRAMVGLNDVIKGFCVHFDAATSQATNLLSVNLNLYGVGVARMNTQAETAIIFGIVHDWETKPELATALGMLGLSGWVTELKTTNQLYEQKYLQRTREFGTANPNTLKAKRDETMVAYYELRKFIEANSVVNPGTVYEKLIGELNALIDQYNELLNTRSAEPVPEPAPTNN